MPAGKTKRIGGDARREILRGVYEENLRIIGKFTSPKVQNKKPSLNKFFLAVLLTLFLTFAEASPLTPLLVTQPLIGGSGVSGDADRAPPSHDENMSEPVSLTTQTTSAPIVHESVSQPPKNIAAAVASEGPPEPALASFDNAAVGDDIVSEPPPDYSLWLKSSGIPLRRLLGLGVKTIMLDPGHGGIDPGTTGLKGTEEKTIALDISKRLYARLSKYGRFRVVITREEDVTLPLNKRIEMAISEKADLFLSIHLNYVPGTTENIIETYYFGPPSDDATRRLAEKENAGSQLGISDFREILEKLENKMKLEESRKLAALIHRSVFLNIRRECNTTQNHGVKAAPFVVLLGANVPAVLAEVSCLSSPEEEIRLKTAAYREKIAGYLEEGILDYLKIGENRNEPKFVAK